MDPADKYAGDILGEEAFQVVKPYMERELLLNCCSKNVFEPLRAAQTQADKTSGTR